MRDSPLRRSSGAGGSGYDGRMRALGAAHLLVMSVALSRGVAARAGEFFEIEAIESQGRSVAVELAELNGDARTDLMVVASLGMPPHERRRVRVHLQKPDGSLPADPDHTIELPPWSAVYDLADLKESPGQEMALLRPEGVTLLSLADASGRSWDLAVPGPTTLGVAGDERGFERFHLVDRGFGPEPWILVPRIGQLLALSPGGEVRARLEVPSRANYWVAPHPGLVLSESDLELVVDAPKLSVGDVDGDARADAVLSTRHELWVYLRREDGSLPGAPDRRLVLRLLAPRDHVRGSGGVASQARDIDGDRKLDLLISHVAGNLSRASSATYVHMNRGGGWNLDEPDRVFRSEDSLDTNALLDLDGDGRSELIRMQLRFDALEIAEFLLTREVDLRVSVHRYHPERGFDEKPWAKAQIGLPFRFETLGLAGFLPAAGVDLNADGFPDFAFSGGGAAIEILLGGGEAPFAGPSYRQEIPTSGVIRFGDLDGNGLLDFVIFDPYEFDVPVRVGRNRGRLPGRRSALTEAAEKMPAEDRDAMRLPR